MKFFLLLLLPLALFGSKILSYNIYDRTDRVDIMITFDTPYEGSIKKSLKDSKIIIKLEDASIESSKLKQLASKYIDTLAITPMSTYVQIVASTPQGVILKASKTSDAYGLRLRFTSKNTPSTKTENSVQTKAQENNSKTTLSTLPTKKTQDLAQSYYIVIGILIIGIIILFIIKRRVTPDTKEQNWLFNKTKAPKPNGAPTNTGDEVTIRFQKALDEKNSVVMLDFAEQSYLVMMGTNNVLLDRFQGDRPSSQEDFETLLQEQHQALEDFLEKPREDDEAMQSYVNKASTISYQV